MDDHNYPGREPLRQAAPNHNHNHNPNPDHQLNHSQSQVSMLSDADPYGFHDGTNGPPRRESLVSMQSRYAEDDAQDLGQSRHLTWGASYSYAGAGGVARGEGYSPVASAGSMGSFSSRTLSRLGRRTSHALPRGQDRYGSIHEEDEAYDLSLLPAAAPMGTGTASHYASITEEEGDDHAEPGVDLTAMLGPSTTHDDEFVRKLQEQEANGTLTGGLGQGFRPDSRLRDADLLQNPPNLGRGLSRSFTRRTSNRRMGRAETIRHMGQDEANRRGQVIEVILEEPAGGDLSNMEGPTTLEPQEVRSSTFPAKEQKTQVFYPQANWKPLSMRWPYLVFLILLSLGLGAMQEVLFRKFRKEALIKFKSPAEVNAGILFLVKFAPTLLAVVYGVLWQFTDFEVRRLEAYYQLSKQGGALASSSINVDYVMSFNFFRPIHALKRGHYAVALSSVATTLAVSLVPTCAAASIILTPGRAERRTAGVEKSLHFAELWSRLLTSTLALCAALGCGLFFLLQKRRSGLLADVRGIAGLASMAVVSHILMDFRDMDTAKHNDIHHKLKHHRYMLLNSSLVPDDRNSIPKPDIFGQEEESHLPQNPHPVMLRAAGSMPFIAGLLAFMGFIPAFLFSDVEVVADKAPWLVTALAVCLKLSWASMETAVRMMEPYYILSKRHAPPKTLTLDYTALPFGYLPLRALFNGHILMFLVGFGTVMTEFLTIMVTGLATVDGKGFITSDTKKKLTYQDSGQETVKSFYVSFAFSMFILLYMSIVASVVFFRRRHPFLPRQPNTIASVLAFIHQSKMIYDFVGTEKSSNAKTLKKLTEVNKTYGLGWFEGRDGQTHCGVDEEELTSNYKHGINFLEGNQPWNTQWDRL